MSPRKHQQVDWGVGRGPLPPRGSWGPPFQSFNPTCYDPGLIMDEITNLAQADQPDGAEMPSEPAPPIDSRFLFVDVAALRAKQLRRGARARIAAADVHLPKKAERIAMEEVRRGLVYYDMPPPKPAAAPDEEE